MDICVRLFCVCVVLCVDSGLAVDLGEVGWGDVDWIGLAQDKGQVESSCEFGNEHSGSMKCWETIKWLHNW
jgi:hypothetical protein